MPNFAGTQLDIADVVRRNDVGKYLVTLVLGGWALMLPPIVAASPEAAAGGSPAVVIKEVKGRVSSPGHRDEAAMILVGTALIGLAAAVRRAA